MQLPVFFEAKSVRGSGRGKGLGSPTINLDLVSVPGDLEDGVYACFAMIEGKHLPGALHLGPRPVFKEDRSCEVYVLDTVIETPPEKMGVEVIAYIRAIRDFPSVESLREQIAADIVEIRRFVV